MYNLTITDEDIQNSKAAIQSYMAFRPSNNSRHEAWVNASSPVLKFPYYGVLYVWARISGNTASIIIEGNPEYYNHALENEYSDKTAKFKFLNGTLIIDTADRCGNKAEINVSSKSE